MKRSRPALLAVLMALLPLAACGGGGDAAGDASANVPEAQRYGGTAIVASSGDIADINPLTSTDAPSDWVRQFVLFMPLLTYNEKFEPVPYMAKSWELNRDTSAITFHLRNDIYWQDGVKTTAYDWKFSYDLARNPKTGFPNTAFWTHYGDAEAVDSFTFRVKMQPHAEYLDPWRSFEAVPEHVLKGVAPEDIHNNAFTTSQPVGNGPFRFVSRAPGQNWVFEANPNFPKDLGGRPYLDRIVFRVIPEPTTLLTELLTGHIDYYIGPGPDQAAQIKSASNVRLLDAPDRQFTSIIWNNRRPMFKDARVRRAITMAIDRDAIIRGMWFGYADISNSTVPPIFWNYDPQAGADLKYNPEEAKRLLAQAGWQDRNGDGILEDAQGHPFQFSLKTNKANQVRADVAEKVQADLRKVGIVAEPQLVEFNTLLAQINNPKNRDFDAVILGWVTEFRIDDTDLFSCKKLDTPFQWAGYCDPETDRLLDTLPKIVDRNAAKPLWSQYQRKIAEDQPYTFLYFPRKLDGVSNRLRDVHPDARGDWVDARKWWIIPSQRGASAPITPANSTTTGQSK